jgi:hypothetical protein
MDKWRGNTGLRQYLQFNHCRMPLRDLRRAVQLKAMMCAFTLDDQKCSGSLVVTASVDDYIGVRDWRRKPPLRLRVPRVRELPRVSETFHDILR